jgi:hypothetical protein
MSKYDQNFPVDFFKARLVKAPITYSFHEKIDFKAATVLKKHYLYLQNQRSASGFSLEGFLDFDNVPQLSP